MEIIIEIEEKPINPRPFLNILLVLLLVFPFLNSSSVPLLQDLHLKEISRTEKAAFLIEKAGYTPRKEIVEALAGQPEEEWNLLLAIAIVESGLNPKAHSDAGAVGLMQINRKVWKLPVRFLENPALNMQLGRAILHHYLNICNGNLRCALRRYSGGAEGYYEKVLKIMKRLER